MLFYPIGLLKHNIALAAVNLVAQITLMVPAPIHS